MNPTAVGEVTRDLRVRAEPLWLSGALAVVTTIASALTLWRNGILTGPAVMNGSARGTCLVLLAVAVPVMTSAIAPSRRGSPRALVVWAGALAYITYNAFALLFATPFNSLFLLYVAMLGLSLASMACLLAGAEPARIRTNRLPARPLAIYIWTVVVLNALVWLRTIIPAIFANDPQSFLTGTGVSTSAIYVQDLAIWLPLMTVSAFWLWHGRPWGVLLSGAGLVFWVIEALGIAVDQWFGSQADPSSDIVSRSAVPAFLVFAVVGLVPVVVHLRSLGSGNEMKEGHIS